MSYYQQTTYPAPNCGSFYTGGNNSNMDCQINVNDPNVNAPERDVISNGIAEIINRYGTVVSYYVNTYNVSAADNLYGEDPTSIFFGPVQLTMYVQLDESNITLKRFGMHGDDEITAYIHLSSYKTAFQSLSVYPALEQAVEPKSGDIFQLTQYGSTRPGDRDGKYFQITQRMDEDISSGMNFLGGHFMWKIRARRYVYSFEPGIPGERGSAQVYDNTFSGNLSSIDAPASEPKSYPGNVEEFSKENIYNQGVNNTNVYGNYGYG